MTVQILAQSPLLALERSAEFPVAVGNAIF